MLRYAHFACLIMLIFYASGKPNPVAGYVMFGAILVFTGFATIAEMLQQMNIKARKED